MSINSINNEIINQKNKMTQLNNQKKEIAGKIDTAQLCNSLIFIIIELFFSKD